VRLSPQRLGKSASFLTSLVVHLLLLLALAMAVLPGVIEPRPPSLLVSTSPVEEDMTEQLEREVQLEAEVAASAISAVNDGVAGMTGQVGSEPTLDQTVAESTQSMNVNIQGPNIQLPQASGLISAVPDEALGEPRAIVDNYDQAFDRITQEILNMLAESKVLVIWCFDQSESMKDDQQEIRNRIHRVYAELGLQSSAQGGALLTAVTSYGEGFRVHTEKATSDVATIRRAIDAVPIDKTGKEMMCSAVMASLGYFQGAASKGRKVALILVTDESGEHQDNNTRLESAIAVAKDSRCTVYTLGREAVFGYPYVHISWRHPQTGHVHWLPVNRGPETGFVEQLQTECFRRRYDAHPSGFGPYEQARLAMETGGIFFMLPSLESKLVRGEKRRYELERMRPYLPDLRSRQQLHAELQESELRTVITQVINDLNPYRPEVAKAMEVRLKFAAKPAEFAKQVQQEQAKAKQYVLYLDAAAKAMEQLKPHRQREYNPRWQANYDLVYAQIIAYTARTYEYGAYLEKFKHDPKQVPLDKPEKKHRLARWDIRETSSIVAPEVSQQYIDRATEMFHEVINQHEGTPWAARAKWELSRGFGVELFPVYHYYGPRPSRPKRSPPTIPIPKL